jgi:hypothetical protein
MTNKLKPTEMMPGNIGLPLIGNTINVLTIFSPQIRSSHFL